MSQSTAEQLQTFEPAGMKEEAAACCRSQGPLPLPSGTQGSQVLIARGKRQCVRQSVDRELVCQVR